MEAAAGAQAQAIPPAPTSENAPANPSGEIPRHHFVNDRICSLRETKSLVGEADNFLQH